ncbi:hypothetical protein ACIGC1_07555 [Peribacillus butanolivorans]
MKDQAFFNVGKAEKIDIKHKPQQQLAADLKSSRTGFKKVAPL